MPGKKNVLLITADQFRADVLGCYGASWMETPNYDRIAAGGIRFDRACASDPICVPARATITTGNHAHKCTGRKSNGGCIRDDQPKIAEIFNAAGYETYAMGKLHYVPYQKPRLVHGFKHWEITESGRLVWQAERTGEDIGGEEYLDYLEKVGYRNMARAHFIGNNNVSGTVSALPAEHYVDTWVANRTMHHLAEHVESMPDKPFFMWMSFPKPHSPYDPPEPYHRMYDPRDIPAPAGSHEMLAGRNPQLAAWRFTFCWDIMSPQQIALARARYFGVVSFEDKQVGRVLDFLDEKGLSDNTVVLFISDHGDLLGDFGCFFKSNFLEGSEHIPLLISSPGDVPEGQSTDALVGTEDVLPTLCDLAGVSSPEGIDGRSLAGICRGQEDRVRDVYIAQCQDAPRQEYMAFDGRWKYCYSELNGTEELYDLNEDPHELANKAPENKAKVSELRGVIIDFCRENGDKAMLDENGDLVKSEFKMPEQRPPMPGSWGQRPY